MQPPDALTLTIEPQANVERYDALRKAWETRHASYPAAGAGAIAIMLRSLKMRGMAQAVGQLAEQGSPTFEAAPPILSQLLKAETADREVKSTAYQL